MSYDPTTVKLCIAGKTFHILKCDESCFSRNRFKASSKKVSDTMINMVIRNIDLSEYTTTIEKSNAIKFNCKLNKATAERLSECPNKSAFISKQLEKYASLPFFERERIFYKDIIEKILLAKSNGNMVLVKANGGKKVLIAPYDILTDEWTSYNYLIGTAFTDKGASITNRRISFISSCEVIGSKYIDPENKPFSDVEIRERILKSGIQFVSSCPEEIKVRLTPKGKYLYDHMIHVRPNIFSIPTESDPEVYTFFCTTAQAEYYFFKFGAEAEIISPISLRKHFISKFKKAYNLYSDNCVFPPI